MDTLTLFFLAGAAAAVFVLGYIALSPAPKPSVMVAATLLGGFAGFTAVTILAEGPLGFLPNHTANLWGVQVWYDLVIALSVALFFVAPRAKAVGMRPAPYVLLTGLTGSIGLLAMVARLFWLERRAA